MAKIECDDTGITYCVFLFLSLIYIKQPESTGMSLKQVQLIGLRFVISHKKNEPESSYGS